MTDLMPPPDDKAKSIAQSTGKKGRPKWQPPDLEVVERFAARGLTQEQIAAALGISPDTLIERKKDFPGFSEAIKKGQAKGLWEVTNGLFCAALDGNVTAAIFYLKNRDPHNWNDRRDYAPAKTTAHQDSPQAQTSITDGRLIGPDKAATSVADPQSTPAPDRPADQACTG